MPLSIKILADASLLGLEALFPPPFLLTYYQNQQQLSLNDILLCRSTLRVDANLLANSAIQCIATASSGTDHIDSDYLAQHHIALFDAKGSNARAVADYVMSILAVHQPIGKLAGVIGVGKVGSRVVERLHTAGFDVICFDPLNVQQDNCLSYCSFNELIDCDVLCVHANLHELEPYPSKNLLNAEFLAQLKSGVTLINASRGGIVNEEALLAMNKPMSYCTDVYINEPIIDPRIIDFATICTPHIAGHSIEAKQAAVVQISQQLHRHYGLAMPLACYSRDDAVPLYSPKQNWQECVSSIYNPLVDTQLLKSAMDKQRAFLTQRKAHYRHDFNCYDPNGLDQQIKRVLG